MELSDSPGHHVDKYQVGPAFLHMGACARGSNSFVLKICLSLDVISLNIAFSFFLSSVSTERCDQSKQGHKECNYNHPDAQANSKN